MPQEHSSYLSKNVVSGMWQPPVNYCDRGGPTDFQTGQTIAFDLSYQP